MFAWMNENSGALLVIVTFAYVIATVFICYYNWKSAKASREQIIASQKQQEQNTGLQLYSMRKEVVNKVAKHQYNEVFWDLPLLFNEKLSDEFQNIAYEAGRLEKMEVLIHSFEEELRILLPKRKEIIDSQIVLAKINKDYDGLKNFIMNTLNEATNKDLLLNSVDEYIDSLKQTDELTRTVNAKTFILIQNLREYIRNSIEIDNCKKQ